MKKHITSWIALLLVMAIAVSGCGKQTESTGNDKESTENRYINCEPGYQQTGGTRPLTPDGGKFSAYSMDEYLLAKEKSGFIGNENWLPWEQFSALGEFYSVFWWEGQPGSCQYKYLYTDEATGKSWIYYVNFDKIPEDSGVTNLKEYWQWYFGSEWDSTEEYVGKQNRRMRVNTPSISPDAFPDSDLTNIDPNDPIFANCKHQSGAFGYYVDDILELSYYAESNCVTNPEFVYNGWLIRISKDPVKESANRYHAFDDTDPEILQKLVNANTYKEAIAELMDPTNNNLPKQPVDSEIARQIKKGMTYSEIHEILRNPGEDIGSGAILYEWELDNGDALHVWFQSSSNLIATEVRIDQKS